MILLPSLVVVGARKTPVAPESGIGEAWERFGLISRMEVP